MVSPGSGLPLAAPACEATEEVVTTMVGVEVSTPMVAALKGVPRESIVSPHPSHFTLTPTPPHPVYLKPSYSFCSRDLSCASNIPVFVDTMSAHAAGNIHLNSRALQDKPTSV